MPSIQLPLLLLCLTLCGVCFNGGHLLPEESENMGKSPLNDILQRSEILILQSALKKAEKEEEINKESNAPMLHWLSKRQHPGKKYLSNLEKRQHPGKREMEDDLDVYLELKRQQPPSRKSLLDQLANSPRAQPTYMNELSKREHPGRRYLMYKHQRPSKRGWNYEAELHGKKRQHPGKRHWNSESSDDTGPCNIRESFTCHKGSLLLDLVDVSRDRVEEKRQHPGKRSAWESEGEE
ncbi:thyrotropin releasing hormone [Chamaea fasciata]|uniref:thyrotropin releasing hormone n=1 Tax=Chamaea fasciata TaxID=190680 RepID=UPI00336A4043